MDLAAVRGSSILLNTLQQPLPGTILYPTKNSPWQAVVAPLSAINLCAEVPKESIIANTDFTTTSLIAKRRLSSKKRRQQQKRQQDEGSCSSLSPSARDVDSLITQSPSVTSTLLSPCEKMDTNNREVPSSSSLLKQHTTSVTPTYTIPLALTTAGVPVTSHQPAPVFAPVRPELTLKMLHEQTLQPPPHPHQPTSSVWAQPRPSDTTHHTPTSAQQKGSDFKWCNAHVFIAKRIRQHQQHQKDLAIAQLDAAVQQQQQLQQQMALLQMYGALPTLPNLVAPVVTGLTDTHLMQGAMATQLVGGLAPPTTNGHAGHQLIGVQLPTVYPAHHSAMPAAAVAVAPLELNTAVGSLLQAGSGGSWAAPVPVIGPCVVNPIQPGMFVTSWVK